VTEPRLKTRLWVQAALRRCLMENIAAVVAARGDDNAGAVLVKLNRGAAGCEVFCQVRDAAGNPAWLCATGVQPVPEDRADSYVARARDVDCDLWVIEVDDRAGRLPFLENVLER